ncbi:hypothetical protein [uncultured Sphingomonas sp.]|nr:hypothetical protein [uncultured Sphingomonas sp.]
MAISPDHDGQRSILRLVARSDAPAGQPLHARRQNPTAAPTDAVTDFPAL